MSFNLDEFEEQIIREQQMMREKQLKERLLRKERSQRRYEQLSSMDDYYRRHQIGNVESFVNLGIPDANEDHKFATIQSDIKFQEFTLPTIVSTNV